MIVFFASPLIPLSLERDANGEVIYKTRFCLIENC